MSTVDARPAPADRRATVRRGGFASQDDAEQALHRFLEGESGGFDADPNQTVADYFNSWLSAKDLVLKPTTMARYRDCVRNDLIPGFGTLKLDQLGHRHIAAFATSQLTAGRGKVTPSRCLATLSSALGAPSANTASPTTPPAHPSCAGHPHQSGGSGHHRRPPASSVRAILTLHLVRSTPR
ncbi:N-terminal phage integrase SAM-like domain-containing protein [Streptomyces sp. NBC_01280]|uniref:hypothetical protein n=1 Tax=Streptomyces sp. NBC_01280 TaxID=2903810 RepID=UPI002E2EB0E6|nr:hypothetical protein [Streptomyces sp. NBC_01280]